MYNQKYTKSELRPYPFLYSSATAVKDLTADMLLFLSIKLELHEPSFCHFIILIYINEF